MAAALENAPKAAAVAVKMLIGGQWREGGVIVNGTSTWDTERRVVFNL